MATRIGWIGASSGVMAYVGEVIHGRIPISASSDGLYVSTTYTPHKFNTYYAYWTMNRSQLTLAADEIPIKVSIGPYEPKGDSYFYNAYNSPYGGPSPSLFLSNGTGESFGTEQVIVSGSAFLEDTSTRTATISESIRQKFAGKPLSISYGNSNSDVKLRGHVKITVTTDYVSGSITYASHPGGKVTGATSATRGQQITLTVTPTTGYVLSSLTASSGQLTKIKENQYTFTMATPAADTTITPTFTQAEYAIVTSVSPSGSGTVTTNVSKAHYKDEITATCSTTSGEYYLTGWKVNSQTYTTNDHVHKFTMPASNVVVTAMHLQHKITWTDAAIKAVQPAGSEYVTLTYSGTCTDNFSRPLKFYIYRDGQMMYATKENDAYVTDETQTTPLEVAAPSLDEQSIVIKVSNEDVDKEIRFSIVAHDDQGITSGGATVSLNVQYINRTVGYYVQKYNGAQMVECVPYYCVDTSELMTADKVISVAKTGDLIKFRLENVSKWLRYHIAYYDPSVTTDIGFILHTKYIDGSGNTIANTFKAVEGEDTVLSTDFNTEHDCAVLEVTFELMPESSVGEDENYYDVEVFDDYRCWSLSIDGSNYAWVEVEPYYYDAENGWTLCSLN